jgi:hypothetical protein
MFAIIAFCAYCLWRGPMRPFAPCIKKRAKPTKPHRETKADLEDPDGILSPDRAPGPNLAFWRRSKVSRTGDWGHQVYLTDLKRQAEADAEGSSAGGSRASGVGYDEEAVREAQDYTMNRLISGQNPKATPSPTSNLGGNRKSRGMMGRSPITASPLGADRHGSPRSSTLSHSRLIKPRQSSPAPSRSPQLGSASTPSSSPLIHPRRPASTILPSPILPPRQSSLYSAMNSALGGHLPPPRDSAHFSPLPPSFTPPAGRNQYSPAASIYNVAVPSVPSVATTAFSPFAPRNGNGEAGTGEGGQRDSIRSARGYAV